MKTQNRDNLNIFQAIDTGDTALIKKIIREDPNQLNVKNEKGLKAYEYARNEGVSEIELILEGAMVAASKSIY